MNGSSLIIVRLDELTTLPVTDVAASIVGGGHPGSVDTVLVAGEVRKWQGRLVHLDVDKIRADAQASRERLLATPLVEGKPPPHALVTAPARLGPGHPHGPCQGGRDRSGRRPTGPKRS